MEFGARRAGPVSGVSCLLIDPRIGCADQDHSDHFFRSGIATQHYCADMNHYPLVEETMRFMGVSYGSGFHFDGDCEAAQA